MARFKARTPAEVVQVLREIQKRNVELVKTVAGGLPRTLFNACQIVEARAKEIITEKGHVVTGSLRRSINTSIQDATETRVLVEVGSFLVYAPFIEALPDGGYLFPASEETFEQVSKYMADHGLAPAVRAWGR